MFLTKCLHGCGLLAHSTREGANRTEHVITVITMRLPGLHAFPELDGGDMPCSDCNRRTTLS